MLERATEGLVVGVDLVGGTTFVDLVEPSEQFALGLAIPAQQCHRQLGETQGSQSVIDHIERLVLLGSNQHGLARRGQVASQVGDGQALSGPWRTLDAHNVGRVVFHHQCHPALGSVGREGKDNPGRVHLGIGELDDGVISRAGNERTECAGVHTTSRSDVLKVRAQEVVGLRRDEQSRLVDDLQWEGNARLVWSAAQ